MTVKKTATSILMTFAMLGMLEVMTPAAHASTILFTAGSADFTFGTNTLTLVLKDTVVNPNDIGLNLSGFMFTLAGSTGGALASSSGMERTIASDGTFTDGAAVDTGWLFSDSSGTITLNDLGGTGPAHTIVGNPGGGGIYTGRREYSRRCTRQPVSSGFRHIQIHFHGGRECVLPPDECRLGVWDDTWLFGQLSGATVAEPISLWLVGGGLLALGLLRKRLP